MLLALDTSTLTLSLALVERGGAVRAEAAVGPPRKQSELLPLAIQDFLAAQGVALADLEGFLVGLGPGSFTGLRIGLATLKGLGYALGKNVAGASSLAAVALDAPEGAACFAIAEAKKGELYLGRYVRQGRALTAFGPEEALGAAEVGRLLGATPGALALGPAAAAYREALVQGGARPEQVSDVVAFPRAARLAQLAALPEAFDLEALIALEPRYVMGSGAEQNPKFPALQGPEPRARLKEDEP